MTTRRVALATSLRAHDHAACGLGDILCGLDHTARDHGDILRGHDHTARALGDILRGHSHTARALGDILRGYGDTARATCDTARALVEAKSCCGVTLRASIKSDSSARVSVSHGIETKTRRPEPPTRCGLTIPGWRTRMRCWKEHAISCGEHQASSREAVSSSSETKSFLGVALPSPLGTVLHCSQALRRGVELKSIAGVTSPCAIEALTFFLTPISASRDQCLGGRAPDSAELAARRHLATGRPPAVENPLACQTQTFVMIYRLHPFRLDTFSVS